MEDFKLTQYSHGAGCGCKISPAILDEILNKQFQPQIFDQLLVGNQSNDDAAVYDMGNGTAIISTTDFFMPIVDDPADFGGIASVNAISDVYAMGGKPLIAIAILGWPVNKIPPYVAGKVLDGSRKACAEAGIPLAGGHSIDSPEPIFGLAVTGSVAIQNLKKNNTAREGDQLFLTKNLGIGIVTTAQKKGIVQDVHLARARHSMLTLNKVGEKMSIMPYVHALTDVTGFGLLGHLTEMCEGSNLSAELYFEQVPRFDFLNDYIAQKSMPGGTQRNWESYGRKINEISDYQCAILADPQTSGGLLVSVAGNKIEEFKTQMQANGLDLQSIGRMVQRRAKVVEVL